MGKSIRWWEGKRLEFNIVFILSGLILFGILVLTSILVKPLYLFFLMPHIIIYVVSVNLMYTGTYLVYLLLISQVNMLTDKQRVLDVSKLMVVGLNTLLFLVAMINFFVVRLW